ncbi:MAG: UDP-N-acetyl-D-glucosamine dehydrogenase, partial [Acidobacteria bacterium]|nr:UDP-N-acetyl-D-glucosamine dehydrogenase [Acidobacteriota bacterium]
MSDARTLLLQRLRGRSATVGVIGLGYVGLPLLVEFAKAGFSTIGFDVDHARVERIGRGESDIPDVATEELVAAVEAGRLLATTDVRRLTEV